MKIKIEADNGTLIRFWLVPVVAMIGGYLAYRSKTALLIILAAFFLAIALNHPVIWLSKHLPNRSRVGGTAVAFSLVVVVLGLLTVLLVPPIVQQTAKVAQTIPAVVDSATSRYNGLNELIERYNAQEQVDDAVESVKQSAASWASAVPTTIVASISTIGQFIAQIVITIVMTFLMLVEGPRALAQFWRLYQDKNRKKRHQYILKRIYRVLSGFIVGQIAIAGIGAVCMALFVFVMSFIFPIPANLAFPTLAIYAVSSLIPFFGSIIAAVILTLLLALNSLPAAIIFLAVYVVWQQIESNVISTAVQSKQINLTALWVFVAAIVGVYTFGIIGAIVAIPIAGIIKVLIEEYMIDRESENPEKRGKLANLAAKLKSGKSLDDAVVEAEQDELKPRKGKKK